MGLIGKINSAFELMRIPHLIFSVPIAIAATFMASNGTPDPRIVLLVAIATGLNHAGGHVMNDFFDRFLDAKNPRTKHRAIPSRRVGPYEALLLSAFLFFGALYVAFSINITCFIIALSGAVFALLYSFNLKNKGILGNITCGFVTALPVLFGWAAIGEPTLITYTLLLIVFIWETGHNILAAASDYTSDKNSKIGTLPVTIGLTRSSIVVLLCYSSIIPIVLTIKSHLPAINFLALSILSWLLAFQGVQFLKKSSEENAKSLFIKSSLFLPFLAIILTLSQLK